MAAAAAVHAVLPSPAAAGFTTSHRPNWPRGLAPLCSSPMSDGSFTAVTLALLRQRLRPHFEEHRLARARAQWVGTRRTEAYVHPSSCSTGLPGADGTTFGAARCE